MRFVIVTGTSTGVGKTVVTAALARRALDTGLRVVVVKPAQTGVAAGEPRDVDTVRALAGLADVVELATYDDPLAPDTAARLRDVPTVSVAELAERMAAAAAPFRLAIIEGAGGVLVRLDTAGGTLLDLAELLTSAGHTVSFVVVTSLALGTLNHTELTVQALACKGFDVQGLVIGSVPAELDLAATCNLSELPRVTGLPVLGAIPTGAGRWSADDFGAACATWLPGASPLFDAAPRQR